MPLYLGGMLRPPEELPPFFRQGDEAEATRYATEAQRAWQAVPGTFDWLLRAVEAHAPSLPH
ncbi:MAG TPA: hypothetical protein VFI42_08065 [Thermomicrobiaceae bacterium]|nr:hypothetical protein [Thermomicrobiaceae bacterium]